MLVTLEQFESKASGKAGTVSSTLQGLRGALAGMSKTLKTYEQKIVDAAGGAEKIAPEGPIAAVVDSGISMLELEIGRLRAAVDAALAAESK